MAFSTFHLAFATCAKAFAILREIRDVGYDTARDGAGVYLFARTRKYYLTVVGLRN